MFTQSNYSNLKIQIMKNLALFLLAVVSLFTTDLLALGSIASSSEAETICVWDSWFKYPKANGNYDQGKDIYVRVDPRKYHDISYMELFINGKFIRKETSYPYEWGKQNGGGDHYLRNMKPGTYKLKVKIRDRCGRYHEKYCTIYVKGHGGGHACHFNNPLHDLHWLKDLKHKHPDYAICEYKINGKRLFKLYRTGVSHYTEYWYDCTGYLVCKFNNGFPSDKVKHARLVKCWYNCHGHDTPQYCNFKFWFKYPIANKHINKGEDIYVKVDVDNYKDVEYMALYINGKFVRKETSAPYEWGKPHSNGDNYLRRMHPGTYKILVKVRDRCGKTYEKYCIVEVKNHHHNPNPVYCNFKAWFKYPVNKKYYYKGQDVYVKLDVDKYRDVEYVELFVNGRLIRKETSFPYEWGKPRGSGDHYLRNCRPGTYKLKVRIKDKCGKFHEKYCTFYVKNRSSS